MRYLGNKRDLLEEIDEFLHRHRVVGQTMMDVFSGTTTVARHFRRRGWTVHANDLMASSYVRQRTYLTLTGEPRLPYPTLKKTIEHLERLAPRFGLFTRQYSPAGRSNRLYFSAENASLLDAAWCQTVAWAAAGDIDEDGLYLLLTLITEAADRVANIAGTYGAYLKKLNPNALKRITYRVPDMGWDGPPGRAHRADGVALVREVPVDLLYIDPPYNGRQYAKYYHVPEILAEMHLATDLRAYERSVYGQTGLRLFDDRMSEFCRKRRVKKAFQDLIDGAQARFILVSYSEEGILSYDDIVKTLERRSPRCRVIFRLVGHKRFRSDSAARRRVGESSVFEWLFLCEVDKDAPVKEPPADPPQQDPQDAEC